MSHETKERRTDGFDHKQGEWREEIPATHCQGEKWTERLKEEDDYWERRSEKYTEYPKYVVENVQTALNEIAEAEGSRMTRSGVQDFRNNKNFMVVEAWEEYDDGTLIRKIIHDDSYGKKILEKKCIKLDLSRLGNVHMVCD